MNQIHFNLTVLIDRQAMVSYALATPISPITPVKTHLLSLSCFREQVGNGLWVGSLTLIFALVSCKKSETQVIPPPVVQVMKITTKDVPLHASLIGQLDSPQNVEVRARVEGFVEDMLFTEGVEVKQGDVLFKLDRKPYVEKLAAANGVLSEATAALNKYQKDVERYTDLYAKRAIPKQDLDNAEASVEVGMANVESAKAKVESAQLDLGYCEVKAPITGLIGAKQVSIGELVGKGQPTLLATMSTLDPIWFYCNVSEVEYIKAEQRSRVIGKNVASLPVHLILSNGKDHTDQGSFVFIDRAVDVKTGTLRVRAEFPNREKLLRPGMFARARVDLGTRKDCVVIPQRAVLEIQGKTFVWIVSKENLTQQRPITVTEQIGSDFIISDGLVPGERIILEGIQKAREGEPVTALTAEQFAAIKAKAEKEIQPQKH
jgi:membrane fusion protein (multidrug efflux system)